MAVALHGVPGQVVVVGQEPVGRAEALGVDVEQVGEFLPQGDGAQPVGIEQPQLEIGLAGLFQAEAQVGKGEEQGQAQGAQHGAAVAPVEPQAGEQEEESRQGDDELRRAITVEGQGGEEDRQVEVARPALQVVQVEVERPGVEGDHEDGFEGGAGVQEPGGGEAEQRHAEPPVAQAEPVAQEQGQRGGAAQRYQGGNGPGDEDGAAEKGRRQHLEVNGQAEVVEVDVFEVGGQQPAQVVAETVAQQFGGQRGVDGLIAEEVDGEVRQAVESGDGVEDQGEGEEGPGEADSLKASAKGVQTSGQQRDGPAGQPGAPDDDLR